MTDNLPPIYFYVPESDWPSDYMPETSQAYWEWMCSRYRLSETDRKYKYLGRYNWTLQAYLNLKERGLRCQLIKTLPSEGIILAHRAFLPFHLRPSPKVMIVCIKADYEEHPYAQLHVVQNDRETKTVRDSYYISNWPQPGLIPRKPERGDRFENIAYFGIEKNLAPELRDPAWSKQLKDIGLNWQVVSRDRWNDFSDIDAIFAVRNFGQKTDYQWKPASKLVNAWLAGVPAILGCESAYQAERQSELDYLEVNSVDEAINALKRLRDDKELRQRMVENGRIRAEFTTPEQLTQRWRKFLMDVAIPEYDRWCRASQLTQQIYLARRYLVVKENGLKPNPVYPHDSELAKPENLGIQQSAIIFLMELYRKLKKKGR
jgi:hypothetical protein